MRSSEIVFILILASISLVSIVDASGALSFDSQSGPRIGTSVGMPRTTEMTYGSTYRGTVSMLGEVGSYLFSATAQDQIYIRAYGDFDTIRPQIKIYKPDGSELTNYDRVQPSGSSFYNFVTCFFSCPVSGVYTVTVGSGTGTKTIPYYIYIQRTNNPGKAIPLSTGQTIEGAIAYPADMLTYTVTPTANTYLSLSVNSGFVDPWIAVFKPDGSLLCEQENIAYFYRVSKTALCPVSGTYRVLVGQTFGGDTGRCGISANYVSSVSPPSLTPSFIATPTSGTAPLQVRFTDTSTGSPTSWSWNFGDGSTSTLQHPSHVYASSGTYTARLTVSKSGVASSTTTRTITVANTNSLGASFTASPTSGAAPLTVQFRDTSTGSPTSWSWNFGDGTTSTLRNPSHTYRRTGTFTARLTVAKPGFASRTTTRTITVTASVIRPDLTITAFNGPDTGIRGRTIAVDATIKNQGALTASGFYVRYYLSTDATVTTGDRLLYTRYVSSLAKGASSSTRNYVTIPTTVARGTYYLGGIVDATYRVSEINEGNNVKVDTGRLRIS